MKFQTAIAETLSPTPPIEKANSAFSFQHSIVNRVEKPLFNKFLSTTFPNSVFDLLTIEVLPEDFFRQRFYKLTNFYLPHSTATTGENPIVFISPKSQRPIQIGQTGFFLGNSWGFWSFQPFWQHLLRRLLYFFIFILFIHIIKYRTK